MPAFSPGPLNREQAKQVSVLLRERVVRPLALEVWTREPLTEATDEHDDGRHGQAALDLMRQLKALNSKLTVTHYDIDRHARVAAERGIEHSPTVTIRSGPRSLRTVGLFHGPFFQGFLDALGLVAIGGSRLGTETRQRLHSIEDEVTIQAYLTPFDPISTPLIPLLAAFAVEGKRFRVTLYEASQFPVLVSQRSIEQVPLIVVNGEQFVGHYSEMDLAEQVARVVEGNAEPVARNQVFTAKYVSEDEARRIGAEMRRAQQEGDPSGEAAVVEPGEVAPPEGDPSDSSPSEGGSFPELYVPGCE